MCQDHADTLRYYDQHAASFRDRTMAADMGEEYARFLQHLAPGGHILDAGCGPGRDAHAFAERGFRVTAMDASAAMVALASAYLGQEVLHLRFQDVAWREEFDGIWASASLLHVPRGEMADVLHRLGQALRPGGVWYMSFLRGEAEVWRQGRYFCNYTAESLSELVAGEPHLRLIDAWDRADSRPDRRGTYWLNAIVQRLPTG